MDSRPADSGAAIRRRRACEACGGRFTTYERCEAAVFVRKRGGRMEPFDAEKVRRGLTSALADRPVSPSAVDDLVADIARQVAVAVGPVESETIGRWVLEGLRELDEIAYLRFASVYKEFQGVVDFERELAELERPFSPSE